MNTGLAVAIRRGLSLAVLAACAVPALALGSGTASAASCPPPPTTVYPFVTWADANGYVLTTGGSFEPGAAAWSLAGGAVTVADNAPNALDPAGDSSALYLPAGASATSACTTAPKIVGIVRFFAKAVDPSAQLRVEVLVKGSTYDAGTISAGSAWAPSPMLPSNAPNYKGAVGYQVRLTAIGGGFTVDDVYFDPSYNP